MDHFSRITAVGRVTADAVRRGSGRHESVTFGFVVNDREWVGGQWHERPMFVDCEAFGADLVAHVHATARRGALVLLEGSLRLNSWKANDGSHKTRHTVVVRDLTALERTKPPVSRQTSDAKTPDPAPATPGHLFDGPASDSGPSSESEPIEPC